MNKMSHLQGCIQKGHCENAPPPLPPLINKIYYILPKGRAHQIEYKILSIVHYFGKSSTNSLLLGEYLPP
jgi:hypothetical protein